ncbi:MULTISPECIES: glycosyltransferase family 39 protein [unclassified Okeania]|uniref:glycosyltransferase family 39 protein n=1 Tax=unclassified Okeania TaxID=2634635 RepID=UPI0013B91DF9|nr:MULTISPECIES: glycosyltransferase family 39 protein [unclassified Okeania]NET12132.1 hypothetical protein [Okeania sp. SIO1H6]NEP75317.1 hypothetical protein [Okeania sp. SIO2G5]NEP96395.1 hypothetical protein [Okeania sp. SIO2F5]NEQ94180.1 hypothetical protein [Okeania sp. SIO2G4]NES77834.1 hypothetical protein [Okeania sp. SIO1H4]
MTTAVILLIGATLRIYQFIFNRPLWLDEAMLAVNVIDRSYIDLLEPLDARQNAPILFLFLVRTSINLFGPNEYALRLPTLVFGLISLWLFYLVSKKYNSPRAVPYALLLFAISNSLVYYSSEFKQYSIDVSVTLFIYILALKLYEKKISYPWAFLYGFVGALSLWLSFPAIFVLASVGFSLILCSLLERKKIYFIKYGIIAFLILISFLLIFYLVINNSLGSDGQLAAWARKGFFAPNPLNSSPKDTLRWYLDTFKNIFINPGSLGVYGLSWVLFICGCTQKIVQQKRFQVFVLVLPIVLALIASILQKYTFTTSSSLAYLPGGRSLLFILPSLLLLVAEGLDYLKKRVHKFVYIGIVFVLFLNPVLIGLKNLENPIVGENIRPVIEYIVDKSKSNDKVYVFYRTKYQFGYYQPRFQNLKNLETIRGVGGKNGFVQDIENLRGNSRVWFLFSYTLERSLKEKEFTLDYIQSLECSLELDRLEKKGASTYLYDLSRC